MMKKIKLSIRPQENCIEVNGKKIKFIFKVIDEPTEDQKNGNFKESRKSVLDIQATPYTTLESSLVSLFLYDNLTCERNKEYIIRAYSNTALPTKNTISYMFIPDKKNLAKRNLLAANTLIKEQRGLFPIQIFIPECKKIKLFAGTHLGWIEQISNQELKEKYSLRNITCSDENREEFFTQFNQQGSDNLNEKTKIKDILWSFRDVFSKDKLDLGHTKIKHQINTGDNAPIVLKPHRIPIAYESKVEDIRGCKIFFDIRLVVRLPPSRNGR
jgi:hypothetical protein